MVLFMLRAADEVRAAQFGGVDRDLDAEMVAVFPFGSERFVKLREQFWLANVP
jgi:hypothetical protein